jgi:hypothetical protein
MGNPKCLGPRISQNPMRKLSQKRQARAEKLMKEGRNKTCRRDSKQNTESGS